VEFEWDEEKRQRVLIDPNRGIDFERAKEIWQGPVVTRAAPSVKKPADPAGPGIRGSTPEVDTPRLCRVLSSLSTPTRPAMDPTSLLIVGRAAERLLIVAFAGLSLWMGWQLFLRLNVEPNQQAELSYKDFLIRLQRVGPGVFFALFGVVVLSVSVASPFEAETRPGNNAPTNRITYLAQSVERDLDRWIPALNTAVSILAIPPEQPLSLPDRRLLAGTTEALAEVRTEFLAQRLGVPKVTAWLDWRESFRSNPNAVPEHFREMVEEVERHAAKLLPEE
jgi:hypothetical protein